MIEILISLLVLGVVVYVVFLIVKMLGLPEPIRQIIYIIIALIVLLYIASLFGFGPGVNAR